MVITSGMITSRMTLSRGCWMPACFSFSRSRRRRSEASERWRWASSKALLMVSLPRSRRSSPTRAGALATLAPFFLPRASSSASAGSMSSLRLATVSARRTSVLGLSADGTTTMGPFRGSGFAATTGGCSSGWDDGGGSAGASAAGGCSTEAGDGSGALAAASRRRCASRSAVSCASASARSLATSRARRRASSSPLERPPICSAWASPSNACASASPGAEMVRFFFFSTTTDFDRPWLKLCRTWPDSTVRFKLRGLRGDTVRVLSLVSLVSLMHVPRSAPLLAQNLQTDTAGGGRPPAVSSGWRRLRTPQHVPHSTGRWPNPIAALSDR